MGPRQSLKLVERLYLLSDCFELDCLDSREGTVSRPPNPGVERGGTHPWVVTGWTAEHADGVIDAPAQRLSRDGFEGAKWGCGLARGPQEIREGETAEHKAARAGRDGGAAEGAQAATERGGE